MVEIISFYHSLPIGVRLVCDFLFTVVFLRGIVANELLSEGKKYWAGIKKQWHSDRNQAIRDHYIQRATGQGHQSITIEDCHDGTCVLFKIESVKPGGLSQSTSQ